jgi:hypothetical protein
MRQLGTVLEQPHLLLEVGVDGIVPVAGGVRDKHAPDRVTQLDVIKTKRRPLPDHCMAIQVAVGTPATEEGKDGISTEMTCNYLSFMRLHS